MSAGVPPAGPGATTDLGRAFELLTDCVAVLDERGDVVDVNPFMLRLLGFERDEVLGRSMAEFVHPDDLERAIRVVSMVSDETLEVPVTPALYRVRQRNGGYLPVEINGTRVPRGQVGTGVGPDPVSYTHLTLPTILRV